MERFENGDVVAHLGEIASAGEPCRTSADNTDFLAVLFRERDGFVFLRAVPVSDETFETTDRDRFALDAEHALAFALIFLWANAAADGWQTGVGFQALSGFGEIAFGERSNKVRNVNMHRAAFDAARLCAMQAARRFGDGRFCAVAKRDFVEIGGAHFRVLHRHVMSRFFAGH